MFRNYEGLERLGESWKLQFSFCTAAIIVGFMQFLVCEDEFYFLPCFSVFSVPSFQDMQKTRLALIEGIGRRLKLSLY